MKKGSKEGTTLLAHKRRPSFVATKLLFEKITKQTVKRQKRIGRIFLRRDKKRNLNFVFFNAQFIFSIIIPHY